MTIEKATLKLYQILFGVSKSTAQRMLTEDKRYYDVHRLNIKHVMERHALTTEDVEKLAL